MARDYAKKPLKQTKYHSEDRSVSRVQWFLYGLFTGIIACVIVSTTSWQSISQQFATKLKQHPIKPKFVQKNQEQKPQFDFYSMLPQMDASNPTKESSPRQQERTKPSQEASFIIQAASFIKASEAERLKAQLLLTGFDANIQIFLKDNKKWYRVIVGPFSDANEARKEQQKLKNEHIDGLLIIQNDEQNKVD